MERISNQGELGYRTKLMDIERASRFARCLGANERFAAVEIATSTRAKSDKKYFVTFLPSNPERLEEMAQRQQDARAERAATQGFSFILDKDAGRPFVWCHSHTSGEVYELDCQGHACSCPDHEYRCRPNGLKCKHQIALTNAIASGENIRTW